MISDLPCCYRQATHRLKPAEQAKCLAAFEADIINLLCGPLAEAKYVALRDGEVFNANLVYLGALGFYGGKKDMALVGEYMACLVPDDEQMRQRKLAQLFLDAYEFINGAGHWQAVARLADGLYQSQQASYSCEELTALLELGGLPPPGAGAGGLHRAAGYGV